MDASVGGNSNAKRKENPMLWTLAVILVILWALGLLTGYTLGGFVHVLIVIAIIAVLFRIISGRRVV
jgi:fatty acid desaturase